MRPPAYQQHPPLPDRLGDPRRQEDGDEGDHGDLQPDAHDPEAAPRIAYQGDQRGEAEEEKHGERHGGGPQPHRQKSLPVHRVVEGDLHLAVEQRLVEVGGIAVTSALLPGCLSTLCPLMNDP